MNSLGKAILKGAVALTFISNLNAQEGNKESIQILAKEETSKFVKDFAEGFEQRVKLVLVISAQQPAKKRITLTGNPGIDGKIAMTDYEYFRPPVSEADTKNIAVTAANSKQYQDIIAPFDVD